MRKAVEVEEVMRLAGSAGVPALLVRRRAGPGPSVLYVHGATFPSALSVAYRFEGRSWMDDLHARGFDAWAFDFAGYGGSDRPPAFAHPASGGPPAGRSPEAVRQLARVVEHVLRTSGRTRVSLVAHSWGTIVAGTYAARHPEAVGRLVLFGPIAQRETPGLPDPGSVGAWRLVSVAEQLARFVEDVPPGHPSVLMEPGLEMWGRAYLADDPDSATRHPDPAVKIPSGPRADILAAWSGMLAYDPSRIAAPTLIVRGEWDSLSTDADARWLIKRLGHGERGDIKLPGGTHLMHLERMRNRLFEATAAFLAIW